MTSQVPTRDLTFDGYAVVRAVISEAEIEEILDELPAVEPGTAGRRDLHKLPWMREFVTRSPLARLAKEVLGDRALAVRILFFDKQPDSNWALPFHQDLTIAVQERVETPGYGPWSTKDGVPHVQPPAEVLEAMLAVRLHLDDCGPENGALRLVPGSHLAGKLNAMQVDDLARTGPVHLACAQHGDVLLMRPLTLHASSPSATPSHRRVLHIDFACAPLEPPLEWFMGWDVDP